MATIRFHSFRAFNVFNRFHVFFLGGDSIRSFSFAMILGVVFGTLSSIFMAAPVAYLTLGHKVENRLAKTETVEVQEA